MGAFRYCLDNPLSLQGSISWRTQGNTGLPNYRMPARDER